jgi:hypothetical protein
LTSDHALLHENTIDVSVVRVRFSYIHLRRTQFITSNHARRKSYRLDDAYLKKILHDVFEASTMRSAMVMFVIVCGSGEYHWLMRLRVFEIGKKAGFLQHKMLFT